MRVRPTAVALCIAVLTMSCSSHEAARQKPEHRSPSTVFIAPTSVSPTTVKTVPLVAWTGPVEHLFFHTLVIQPQLAFVNDHIGQGFRDYFVTVGEFRSILDQLFANGWTLVDIHRAVAGTVRVPAGRRPFVLSVDDVNYYDYSRPLGLGWRLVLDPHGDVKVEERDPNGTRITDNDIIPIVEQFVVKHPEFSADGAKGLLAVTGYEGVLGERTNERTSIDLPQRIARARALVAALRAHGWTFASHSYGHIDVHKRDIATLTKDSARWKAEVEPIVGPTDIFVYPFGSGVPLSSPKIGVLRSFGFTILCDIDKVPRMTHSNHVALMSRRHIDGIAFAEQGANLAALFNVGAVIDRAARRLPSGDVG